MLIFRMSHILREVPLKKTCIALKKVFTMTLNFIHGKRKPLTTSTVIISFCILSKHKIRLH